MEPTWRHTQEPQDRAQREVLAGPIHGAQDPQPGAPVRQTPYSKAKPRGSEQGQHEPEQRREFLDASPQLGDLLSEFGLSQVRNIQTDHDRRSRAKPPRAVERGTPRSVAMVTSLVRWTRFRSRWS